MKNGILYMSDDSRTVLSVDSVDAIRRSNRPCRLYVLLGNSSHVFAYPTQESADADFQKVKESMGDDALSLNDMEPSVVDTTAIMGVRDFRGDLLVLLQSWTLICKYPSSEARVKDYDRVVSALQVS